MQLKWGFRIFVLYISIILCLNTAIFSFTSALEASPDIEAASAILVEESRGQVLFEKNSSQKLHVSSANKIMTAIIALENVSPDTKIAISKEALDVNGSLLNLEAGEKFSVEDLVFAIILTPANDAANALAEFVGGDKDKFTQLMNKKAKELHMENTNFINPTGLLDENQYTTAYDISLLMRYALNNPIFNNIFSTRGKPFNSQVLINHNKLFWMYDGVDGGKAGYNSKEKQSAITTAQKDGQRLLAVALESSEDGIWKDSIKIFDYGFNNYRTGTLAKNGQILHTISVENNDINLICKEDVYYTYPIGEDNIKSIEYDLRKNVKLPIAVTDPIGSIKYTLKDNTVLNVDLFPERSVALPQSKKDYLQKILNENRTLVNVVIFLLIVELFLIIRKLIQIFKNIKLKKQKSE